MPEVNFAAICHRYGDVTASPECRVEYRVLGGVSGPPGGSDAAFPSPGNCYSFRSAAGAADWGWQMKSSFLMSGLMLLVGGLVSLQTHAQEPSTHAALAIDRKAGSLYGWAVDQPSSDAASARARDECLQRNGSCEVVLQFAGGCGAYVVERGNDSLYGWATASDRASAEARALEEARKRGGQDVLVRVWGCNTGPLTPDVAAPSESGVHFVYVLRVTRGELVKLCFASNPFYVNGVAVRSGDKWTWAPDSADQLAPYVSRFGAAVNAREPGTAVELEGGWRGGNELDFDMLPGFGGNLSQRRDRMQGAVEGFAEDCRSRGYEVVSIPL